MGLKRVRLEIALAPAGAKMGWQRQTRPNGFRHLYTVYVVTTYLHGHYCLLCASIYVSDMIGCLHVLRFLWSPYVIGQTIIFLPCGFFLSSSFLLLA